MYLNILLFFFNLIAITKCTLSMHCAINVIAKLYVCVYIYIYIICDTKCMFVTCSNPLKLLCLSVDKTRGLLYELPESTH